jgi:hypothetical protein
VSGAVKRLRVGDLAATSQMVRRRLRNGRLIGIRNPSYWALPTFQFTKAGQLLPGIPEVLAIFRRHPVYSDSLVLGFLFDPNYHLTCRRPIDVLRTGRQDRVRRVSFAAEAELF